jgi:acetyl esterase/lipase
MHMRCRLPGSLSWLLVLLLLGLATSSVRPADAEKKAKFEVEVVKDIAYFEGEGADKVRHKLDLYLPKGHKEFPVLFFVHGGAWQRGSKEHLGVYPALGKALAEQGVGTVVINYRLSPAVAHPEHIKDVARAFAWTHKNIEKYGGRPDQLFVCGHSAGGHLVSLLATDERYLKAEELSFRDIKGVISLSGVYIIPEKIFPKVFSTDEDRKQASPINHVKEGLPPFLLLYADDDMPGCDKKPAEAFAKALKEKSNKVETKEIEDSNHYLIILSATQPDDLVFKTILKFVMTNTAKE